MSESDSEEQNLKRALALSLQQHVSSPASNGSLPKVISLISDDEDGDDDLDAPVVRRQQPVDKSFASGRTTKDNVQEKPAKISLLKPKDSIIIEESDGESTGGPTIQRGVRDTARPLVDRSPAPSTQGLGILTSLNRKQMEEERLARANKRKAEILSAQRDDLHDGTLGSGISRTHDDQPAAKRSMVRPNPQNQVSQINKNIFASLTCT